MKKVLFGVVIGMAGAAVYKYVYEKGVQDGIDISSAILKIYAKSVGGSKDAGVSE